MIAGDEDWLSQYSLLDEEPLREVEEVDKVETVTMDVVLDTIAPYNVPVVEEISFPSPDQVAAPEDRSCCHNSGIHIMKWGNMVGFEQQHHLQRGIPQQGLHGRGHLHQVNLAKTYNEDEDEETRLCSTLPGSELSKEDGRVDIGQVHGHPG